MQLIFKSLTTQMTNFFTTLFTQRIHQNTLSKSCPKDKQNQSQGNLLPYKQPAHKTSKNSKPQLYRNAVGLVVLLISLFLPATLMLSSVFVSSAHAEPNVTLLNHDGTKADSATATPTENDAKEQSAEETQATNATNSLSAQRQPTDSELSIANQELLTRNAQLQRQVNDLETQVNVLKNEHSGQLFLYGVFTVLISIGIGILISKTLSARRDHW